MLQSNCPKLISCQFLGNNKGFILNFLKCHGEETAKNIQGCRLLHMFPTQGTQICINVIPRVQGMQKTLWTNGVSSEQSTTRPAAYDRRIRLTLSVQKTSPHVTCTEKTG